MKQTLDDLKTLPGFIGAFCFDPRTGIAASNLPPIFKEEKLAGVGKMLVKIHQAGRGHFPDLTEAALHYDESLLVLREIGGGFFLAVFCDPSVSTTLLGMSLNLAVEELRGKVPQTGSAPLPVASSEPSPAPPAASLGAAEALVEQGPLAETLGAMQTLLAKIMGPMSRILFIEAVAAWMGRCRPGAETLPELMALLEKEIGDEEKIVRYRHLVSPHLPKAGG